MKKKDLRSDNKNSTNPKKVVPKAQKMDFADLITGNKYAVIIILVLILIVYSGCINNELVNFDDNTMMENVGIIKNSGLHLIRDSFILDAMAGTSGMFYRPFQTFILIILSYTGSIKGYFIFLLLIHFVNSIMLFNLLKLLSLEKFKSLLIAILFSVHPLFAPVINWIPSIGDATVTLFILISFISFIRYTGNFDLKFLLLHLVSFFFAVLSKEIALVFPLICFAYLFIFKGVKRVKEQFKYSIIPGIFWVIIPAVYLYLRNTSIHSLEAETANFSIITFLKNLPVIFQFIFKFFIPANLSLVSMNSYLRISGGLLIAVLIIFFAYRQGKSKLFLFSALWLVFFLLPTFIFKHPQYDYLEHRGYLPLISAAFIIASIKWNKYDHLVLIPLIALFSILSFMRSKDFSNPVRFYSAITKNEKVPLAFNNLAIEYDNSGDFQSALSELDNALNLNPEYVDALVNRGNLKALRLNNFSGAIKDYIQAIGYIENDDNLKKKINDYADVYNNMGTAKSRLNDIKGALNDYSKSLEINSDFAKAFYNRGILKFETLKDNEGAMDDLNRAIEIDPEYYEAFVNRGVIREITFRDYSGALADYNKAISIKPDFSLAYYNRGIYFQGQENYTQACKDWQIAANLGHAGAVKMLGSFCK